MRRIADKLVENKAFPVVRFFLFFLILGAVYLHYPLHEQLITFGDGTSSIYIPYWFGKQYASGAIPLWSPEAAAGVPISSHMLGAFFLPSILFAQLPIEWFSFLNYVFFVAFGASFFSSFLEELHVKRPLATLLGFTFLFAIHMGGLRKYHIAIIQSCSFYPFVFWAFQHYLNNRNVRGIVLAGLGCGTLLLIATPSVQYAMYLMIAACVYVVVEGIHLKFPAKNY